ncbi:hypothetical protein PsorP6_011273 [Peronosclerospora sorghi]|uniref:Uncharacterized protein n=1 Tax=Peronosclerospora sorghi TaxID=230839 RepID=A0ACC0WJ11_9STRA|nr:hypothetical protein PsorP6_011273 [Peronosclerospora sorghi]
METPDASLALVNVVVRNVYTPLESLTLSVDAQTLVGELKRRLSVELPSHPPVSSQKLIFGGKICNDEEPLALVLVQLQTSQQTSDEREGPAVPVVFHLLVHSSGGRKNKCEEMKMSAHALPHEATEALDSPRPSESKTPALDEPLSSNSPPPQPQPQPQPTSSEPPAITQQQQHILRQSMLVQQQIMVLQQIQYLQYLLLQQQPQQSTPSAEAQPQPFVVQYAPPCGNFHDMMQQRMFPGTSRPQAQESSAENPETASTPAAATEPAVEPRRRWMLVEVAREVYPLLDFRMALKMAFMLFMIGQDMPMDRILMLGLLSFISYLHITGILAKLYEVYTRRRGINGQDAPAQSNAQAAANPVPASGYACLTRVLRISADRGFVQDVKYFLVGFLLSLVPAWHPQPIQGGAPRQDNPMPDNVPLQEI